MGVCEVVVQFDCEVFVWVQIFEFVGSGGFGYLEV